jgi:uncharacterized protein YebE (UPF0316 family)
LLILSYFPSDFIFFIEAIVPNTVDGAFSGIDITHNVVYKEIFADLPQQLRSSNYLT